MRTELRDSTGALVGEVVLTDGVAEVKGAAWLADVNVIEPGLGRTPSRIVMPADGEAYLRALPDTLRGPYLSATLVEKPRPSPHFSPAE
jgi:hypothetical protein